MKDRFFVNYLIISFMMFYYSRRGAMMMINEIGTNSKRYPKGFKPPAKWMKKHYKIKDRMIPRYAYYELLFSIFFLFLGPTNSIISWLFKQSIIDGVLSITQFSLGTLNLIMSEIFYSYYKK